MFRDKSKQLAYNSNVSAFLRAAEDRRSLGVVRASAHEDHAAAAKPINFKAYERPTLPAARQSPAALAAGPPPVLASGAASIHDMSSGCQRASSTVAWAQDLM